MVYFCTRCGTGLEYNGKNLEPIEVLFAQPILQKDSEPELFLPFWSFRLDISIKAKEVYLPLLFRRDFMDEENILFTNKSLIETILNKQKEKKIKDQKDFTVYVPSFPTTGMYAYSSDIGKVFTRAQPVLSFYEQNKKMESCIYNAIDALSIAEDEYISLQTAIIPNLLALDLSFNVKNKRVIGIPYAKKEKGVFYDQIIGEMLLASALRMEK
jgi:hypothetical protein